MQSEREEGKTCLALALAAAKVPAHSLCVVGVDLHGYGQKAKLGGFLTYYTIKLSIHFYRFFLYHRMPSAVLFLLETV